MNILTRKQKKALAVRAARKALEQLPAASKKLRVAAALLEPQNLKRLGVAAAGSAAVLGLTASAIRTRLYRRALARELKRQLAGRARLLYRTYIYGLDGCSKEEKQQLWEHYKPNYERLLCRVTGE